MRLLAAALLASSLVAASSPAFADGPSAPPGAEASAPSTTTWYGYQTLATDAVAGLLMVPLLTGSNSATEQGFGVGTAVMYGLGAPIVHFSHGRVGAGLADLAIRVAAPVLGAFVGFQAAGGDMSGEFAGIIDGFALGMIGAVAVDAAVLAYEPTPVETPPSPAARWSDASTSTSTSTLQPSVAVAPERTGGARATVGLMGAF